MHRTLHTPLAGKIRAAGWLKQQLHYDLHHGFVGALDKLVPELIIEDDIYHADRLTKADKAKDVGAVAQDADWEVQYLWWNSETQSNWWDGYVRHVLMEGSDQQKQKVENYINRVLSSQDEDGYLGIYAQDLRYKASGENGELWAQASLLRVLLGYYEHTNRQDVLEAVVRSVGVTMNAWPIGSGKPFDVKEPYAGVGHGLVYTDVLDRLFDYTQERQYIDYANFLYLNYCQYELCDNDIQWGNLLDDNYRFQGHGVHTWEHLRPLVVSCYASQSPLLMEGLHAFLRRLPHYLTPSGAPIGDEFILGKFVDSTKVGYEYCSLQEWLDSLITLTKNSGQTQWLDDVEKLFFNAALGARHPDGKGIAYLKTDNSYSMTGTAGLHECEGSVHDVQTRYKYSPTHQEAAVCCVPNAGRITPYFIKSMWMNTVSGVLKALYGPSVYQTEIKGVKVIFEEQSSYPAELNSIIHVRSEKEITFTLTLRVPAWAQSVYVNGKKATVSNGQIELSQNWLDSVVDIQFMTVPLKHEDQQGEFYFSYGPLIYALPLDSCLEVEREFLGGMFADRKYHMTEEYDPISLPEGTMPRLNSCNAVELCGGQARTIQVGDYTLRPLAGTILRQVTFAKQ
ncbi:beta-L-arabinofuranosidase domain-containing protein [Vibrio sp. WXL103]|uniref:beta-L-arabinofuranosidase domain-containing protein n=1 Tax=Vibrio sp. WXL103 TaxID=3450710 RepID=UPI003EC582A6